MEKKKLPYEPSLMEVTKLLPIDVLTSSVQGTDSPFDDEENLDDGSWT